MPDDATMTAKYSAAIDFSQDMSINYQIAQRQEASGEEKTPPLTNPSPSEIVKIINKRYTRAKIDVICRLHGIKTARSINKCALMTSLIVKFGAAVLDDAILHRPSAVARDTAD